MTDLFRGSRKRIDNLMEKYSKKVDSESIHKKISDEVMKNYFEATTPNHSDSGEAKPKTYTIRTMCDNCCKVQDVTILFGVPCEEDTQTCNACGCKLYNIPYIVRHDV